MNIGIIGATGKLGNLLVQKLIDKGENPTAIIRNKEKLTVPTIPTIEKNIFNLTSSDVEKFDVLVNTFNAPLDNPEQFITSTDHLIEVLKGTKTRLVFAGGAGVLLVDERTMLVDTPEIPAEFKPTAQAEVTAFKNLAETGDFDWTYMAPPAVMEFDAPHTGRHLFSGNKLGVNNDGKSFISYADYADAFVEKIFDPENHAIVGVYA